MKRAAAFDWGCVFWVSLVFLLSYRAPWALQPGWQSDDGCYISRLMWFFGVTLPNACSPEFYPSNYFAPGAPITWIPAGALSLLTSWVFGIELTRILPPFLSIYSFLLWGVSLWILRRILETYKRPGSLGLAVLLNLPLLYYATSRATMAHTAEAVWAFAMIWGIRAKHLKVASLSALMLGLTRFHDIPAWGMVLTAAAPGLRLFLGKTKKDRWALPMTIAASLIAVATLVWVGWVGMERGYGLVTFESMWNDLSWDGAAKFFIRLNWGVLWTAPWWLAAWIFGFLRWKTLSPSAQAGWLWMAVTVLACISWQGNGGDFGYRYLIGSYGAALLIWMELLETGTPRMKRFVALTWAGAAWQTLLTVMYKTTSNMAVFARADFGHIGTMNYVLELLQNLFNPLVYWRILIQQFPIVSLLISWTKPDAQEYQNYIIRDPAHVTILCIATVIAITMVYFSARRLMRRRTSA